VSNIRRLALALSAPMVVLAAMPSPAAAQFSESYKFLDSVKKKELAEVNEMLDKGSPNLVNTRDITSGDTGMHLVVARRDLPWLEYLIAKGARVNVSNNRGVTPLVAATNLNWIEGVEVLIANGARVDESNNSGETPLITAVHNRNIPLIRLLLKAGADPDRADNSGRSAREYAKLAESPAILSVIASDTKPKTKAGEGGKVYGPKF
jgi:uncharacterized protein